MKDDDPTAVHQKQKKYERSRHLVSWLRDRSACNLWTAAFFMPLTEQNLQLLPTSGVLDNLLKGNWATQAIVDAADQLAEEYYFFHWPLEFPEVFESGGFDCILGNPPWERLKVSSKEVVGNSEQEQDALKRLAAKQKHFLRNSGRYPKSSGGDVNTYAVFADLNISIISRRAFCGFIVPSKLMTSDTLKNFVEDLLTGNRVASFLDFTNRGYIFKGVESTCQFCLLTLCGESSGSIVFAAQRWQVSELSKKGALFSVKPYQISLLSPNTKSFPIPQTEVDLELLLKLHSHVPILKSEIYSTERMDESWLIKPWIQFHMSNDKKHFIKITELDQSCSLKQNLYISENSHDVYLPLYESKLCDSYNHRFATFEGIAETQKYGTKPRTNIPQEEKLKDPEWSIMPRYWIKQSESESRIDCSWKFNWLLGFRNTMNSVADSRSLRATILPRFGVGNSMPLICTEQPTQLIACLTASLNSIVVDYAVKNKVSGSNLNYFLIYQLPIIPPSAYNQADTDFIVSRVLELTYTAWDLQPFAQDMGYDGEPFIWNPERRALLRAELDAYYAHLYGLTRDELRYILDPADVYGPDFPSETFRVLKNNEMKQFGEYRTQRLVLEAWDKLFGKNS